MKEEIPLSILIIDQDQSSIELLRNNLLKEKNVIEVDSCNTIKDAKGLLNSNHVNTIFIDPLAFDINHASDFIFNVRKILPEIVFVLFINLLKAEQNPSEFYRGERTRFNHYYKLDKRTTIEGFTDELEVVFNQIQNDLTWRMSEENIAKLTKISKEYSTDNSETEEVKLINELREAVELLQTKTKEKQLAIKEKTVFVSYKFAEEEYVEGLINYLTDNGFEAITGKESNTYISKSIIKKIKESEYFLCLMTKDKEKKDGTFTTSPWLLEEKGVAIAANKKIVILIEEGVTDFGGLHGDWQRIHFSAKGFLVAVQKAVKQLKSYEGEN